MPWLMPVHFSFSFALWKSWQTMWYISVIHGVIGLVSISVVYQQFACFGWCEYNRAMVIMLKTVREWELDIRCNIWPTSMKTLILQGLMCVHFYNYQTKHIFFHQTLCLLSELYINCHVEILYIKYPDFIVVGILGRSYVIHVICNIECTPHVVCLTPHS